MTSLPPSADENLRLLTEIAAACARSAMRAFDDVGDSLDLWSDVSPGVVAAIQSGRSAALEATTGYVPRAIAEQGDDIGRATSEVSLDGILATAPDGRTIPGLVDQAAVRARTDMSRGASFADAIADARAWVGKAALETVRETATDLRTLDMIRHPEVRGYIRHLALPACRLCIPLAGRFYAWNAGFRRHFGCDCVHVPVTSVTAGDKLRTDPRAYWDSMTPAQKVEVAGAETAKAIDEHGVDLIRALNTKNRTKKKRLFDGNLIDFESETVEETRRRTLRMLRSDGARPSVEDIVKASGDDRERATAWLTEAGYLRPIGFDYADRTQRRAAAKSKRTRDILDPEQQTSTERRFARAYSERETNPDAWSAARSALPTATSNVRDLARVLGVL